MLRIARSLTFLICLALPGLALGQGPRRSNFDSGMPPMQIKLTKDSVTRLIAALPEVTKAASKHQAQFMSSLTGGTGPAGAPRLSPEEMEALRAIFAKHGFAMEEFAMQVSALLATYLLLSPDAFEHHLPSEQKPEIRAILIDPNVPQERKDTLRKQIQFARANKDKIRDQLEMLTSAENRTVVKPLLPQVRKAFEAAEEAARESMRAKQPGPRRSEAP